MNSIAIMIIIVCLLFFISGCLLGSAMASSKLNELKNRLQKTRTESDHLIEECNWLKKTHDEVLADYRNLYTYYNGIRRQCFAQQNMIVALKAETRQLQRKLIPPKRESDIAALKERITTLEKEILTYQKYQPFYQKYLDQISVENELRFQIQQLKDKLSLICDTNLSVPTIGRRQPLNASVFEASGNLARIFDSLVQLFSSQIFENGCVISDDMGFVLASSCENPEELAGISVLFDQCEEMIRRNSTFNDIARLCFVNKDNQHLTVFPLALDNMRVFCSGLSRNPFSCESGLNTIVLPQTVQNQRGI